MTSRMTIYDRRGNPLTEMDATVQRSWILNEVGEANFVVSQFDQKFQRKYIEFGNLVLVEHDKLPAWVGVIDPERKWSSWTATVRAFSAEKLLAFRRGPQAMTVTGTAGSIFQQMVDIANLEEDTLIRVEGVYGVLPVRQETLNLTRILDEVNRVAERSENDWGVEPTLGLDGRLSLAASWWLRRGVRRMVGLIEGHNLAEGGSSTMTEQGEIINDLMGYGEGATWDSRETWLEMDTESIAQYGRRQGSMGFDGVTQMETLRQNTQAALAESAWPRRTWRISALDVEETYYNLRLGDELPLVMHTTGFTGDVVGTEANVRIKGMSFSDDKGKVDLVVDEVALT
jgi:hypothetical protein